MQAWPSHVLATDYLLEIQAQQMKSGNLCMHLAAVSISPVFRLAQIVLLHIKLCLQHASEYTVHSSPARLGWRQASLSDRPS